MKITNKQKKQIQQLKKLGLTSYEVSQKLEIPQSIIWYWWSEETRKTRIEGAKRYYKNLPKEKKKQIARRYSSYISSYMKDRYNTDEVFREKIKERSREYQRRKSLERKTNGR